MINRLKILDELAALQARLNELFDEQFHEQEMTAGNWAPPVDVYETATDLVVAAELPGIKREEVEVTVVGDKLVLRGNRPRQRDTEDEHFQRMERQYGSFYRAFTLPQAIDAEAITAKLNQGVLVVKLPKRPMAQGQQIEIHGGE